MISSNNYTNISLHINNRVTKKVDTAKIPSSCTGGKKKLKEGWDHIGIVLERAE